MATISFSTKFDLTLSPIQVVFTDTTDWAGQSINTANVNGCFSILSPSGVIIYNNTDFSNANCDIWIDNYLGSQQVIQLPLGTDGFPEVGNYVITYSVFDSNLVTYYTKTNTVSYQYTSPKICIRQMIDCISPLFSSVDATDYDVNGIAPVIDGTQTLDYPYGSAGESSPVILPFTASGSVIAVSVFYQGTQSTEIVAGLIYNIISGVNGFSIVDSIKGTREVKVDCDYICSILCCVQTFDALKESYRETNSVLFQQYENIFQEIMSYISLMQLSINCGLGDDVCTYLQKIKILSRCTDKCKCNSTQSSRVIGLGYLVGPAGAQGIQGIQGASGNNGNYVTVESETPGINCTTGGVKVTLYNGVSFAIISTNYICNGAAGTNGIDAFKRIKIFSGTGDSNTFTITYADLTACEPNPIGCLDDPGDTLGWVDFHVQVWMLGIITPNVWSNITSKTGVTISVDDISHDLIIFLNFTPAPDPVPVRVIILG